MKQEIKQKYDDLQRRYDLPSYDELDHVFEITDSIREKKYVPDKLLRFIRRRMISLIDYWTGYLHQIVLPGQHNMILYEESSYFSEEEKNEVIKTMTKILSVTRETIKKELLCDEKEDAAYIKKLYDLWIEMLPELNKYVDKSVNIWKDKLKQ